MEKILDIYAIIGIKQEQEFTADLVKEWRRAVQKWHPEKLSQLEDRFPRKNRQELEVMADDKTRALVAIGDLVKRLAGDSEAKGTYDQMLALQRRAETGAKPSVETRDDTERHRGESGGSRSSRGPFNGAGERETSISSDLRGSGVYDYQGDVRICGDLRGSVVLNVAGNLVIEGDLRGSCVVNARNITIEGDLSGSPVVNAAGRVVIEGDRSGSAVVNARSGVIVKGDDLSQRGGRHGGSDVHINTGGAAFVGGRVNGGVSVSSGGVYVGGSFNEGGSFSTDGSLNITNGVTSTFGATWIKIDNGKDVLQILGADINRNGTVYGGRVVLNGKNVPQNISGGVDLSKLDTPLAARFKGADRGGPRPGNW